MAPVEDVEPQDCDVLRIVAAGEASGQQVGITNQVVVLPYRRWGISAGAVDTGTPLAIAGRMLANGEITRRGVFGPEMCVPIDPFFRELARYDMHVTVTLTVAIFSSRSFFQVSSEAISKTTWGAGPVFPTRQLLTCLNSIPLMMAMSGARGYSRGLGV